METIEEIKVKLSGQPVERLPEYLSVYAEDTRAGVKVLVEAYDKKHQAHLKERKRLEALCHFENQLYEKGVETIAGMDEVGRGPLAGPVVACALTLPKGFFIPGINDSKKLSEKKRKEIYGQLKNYADTGVGIVDPVTIDRINILQATYKAMAQAVANLQSPPQFLLVDAVHVPGIKISQRAIVKGDALSISIAAASIFAKVTRDEMMLQYHEIYPEYNFASNKGYGSEEHVKALKEYGACPIHRNSFLRNILAEESQ